MQMQRVVSTEHALSAELRRSEKLIWSGRPRQGVFLTQRDAGMIPFTLMWGGFSVFWEFKAVSSGGPLFFDLWGVPLVLVGLYMIVGRFFSEAMLRSRTYYGLTRRPIGAQPSLRPAPGDPMLPKHPIRGALRRSSRRTCKTLTIPMRRICLQ
jgi:hypothetical protein